MCSATTGVACTLGYSGAFWVVSGMGVDYLVFNDGLAVAIAAIRWTYSLAVD